MRAISTTSKRELSSNFFPTRQGNWMAQFKRGVFSTCGAPRPGRHKTVSTQKIIDQIPKLILENHKISPKSIAVQLGMSLSGLGPSFMKILTCGNSPRSGSRNAWLYHYNPETKQQLMEWRHSGSLRPKKLRVQKSARNVLASIFGDQDGILLIDYFPKGKIINAEYYSSLLVQSKDILKNKRCGSFTKGVLFLHDNARLSGHLQPRRNWPKFSASVLIIHSILHVLSFVRSTLNKSRVWLL